MALNCRDSEPCRDFAVEKELTSRRRVYRRRTMRCQKDGNPEESVKDDLERKTSREAS